ncbi:MAG: hypothetical protein Q9172_004630 [Xanthocarpia lactea]
MRLLTSLPSLLFSLPLLTAAQQQKPLSENLQSWFDKAKSYIPSAATAPIASTAAKAAANNVVTLTTDNWKSVISPSSLSDPSEGPEEWMVLFSGGNRSCYGRCARVEKAWDESAALLAANPTAPNLAYVHCDKSPVLCTTWPASVPSIWHIQLPATGADQSQPATTIHKIPLNSSTVTAADIVNIHTEKTYEKRPVYEGALHPFDGWFAKAGLIVPLGMGSRYFMGKRTGGGQAGPQRSPPLGGAPPANEPVAR